LRRVSISQRWGYARGLSYSVSVEVVVNTTVSDKIKHEGDPQHNPFVTQDASPEKKVKNQSKPRNGP
jgi:hypothetical protein